jgi:hypothetical protein
LGASTFDVSVEGEMRTTNMSKSIEVLKTKVQYIDVIVLLGKLCKSSPTKYNHILTLIAESEAFNELEKEILKVSKEEHEEEIIDASRDFLFLISALKYIRLLIRVCYNYSEFDHNADTKINVLSNIEKFIMDIEVVNKSSNWHDQLLCSIKVWKNAIAIEPDTIIIKRFGTAAVYFLSDLIKSNGSRDVSSFRESIEKLSNVNAVISESCGRGVRFDAMEIQVCNKCVIKSYEK